MSEPQPELQTLIDEFAKQRGLPPNAVRNLQEAVETSGYLANRMHDEIQSGRLKHLALSDNPNEGGHFNDKTGTLAISRDVFLPQDAREDRSVVVDRVVAVMGHEIGHGGQAEWRALELKNLQDSVQTAVWTQRDPPNNFMDLTQPVDRYLDFTRKDEAMAEISGWNALADRVRGDRASVPMQEMLSRQQVGTQFVERQPDGKYQLAEGIQLSPEGNILIGKPMQQSANLEAAALSYYDLPAEQAKLGKHGDANYRNLYGAYAMGVIASTVNSAERELGRDADEIRLDMASLKLDRTKLERAGLDLDGQSMYFTDTSHGKMRGVSLSHTGRGSGNTPDAQPDNDQLRTAPAPNALSPADQRLHQRMLEVGRAHGLDEERSGNLAAQGLLAFKQDKLTGRADDVGIYGGNLMTSYFPFGKDREPNHHTPPLDVEAASKVPSQQTLQEVIKVDQQQQVQKQSMSQQQTQEQGGPNGPTMGARTM